MLTQLDDEQLQAYEERVKAHLARWSDRPQQTRYAVTAPNDYYSEEKLLNSYEEARAAAIVPFENQGQVAIWGQIPIIVKTRLKTTWEKGFSDLKTFCPWPANRKTVPTTEHYASPFCRIGVYLIQAHKKEQDKDFFCRVAYPDGLRPASGPGFFRGGVFTPFDENPEPEGEEPFYARMP